MKNPVFFINQFANAHPGSVEKAYGQIQDTEAGKRFGTRFKEEFSYWAWRACAIANVAMILATEGKLKESLYDLICEALLLDGYAYRSLRGTVDVGWKHKALCLMLEKRGFKTAILRNTTLEEAQKLLQEGKYVVLSIRSDSGGHMVLVKDINREHIVYNDPYQFRDMGGENIRTARDSFEGKFLRKGIAAWIA